ncbi:hypothetical protein G5V57_24375 [Nordella sp. HKS 07]|uniref:hypothetical protein n=1 Tax=Nordella sp. HKS 07 TaxID=2712222 RepID=UPI0013E11817|nr:hypothetical protein [Nordella sp. HKS 07]QIG50589.1 hypothetical protein G5V57_24375 [Nordella sp. HKS 07]
MTDNRKARFSAADLLKDLAEGLRQARETAAPRTYEGEPPALIGDDNAATLIRVVEALEIVSGFESEETKSYFTTEPVEIGRPRAALRRTYH